MKKPFVIASKTPCVHCGSPYNYLFCHGGARLDGVPFNLAYAVHCKKCQAVGPVAKTAQEAVRAWEHRAEPCFDEPMPRDLWAGTAFEEEEEAPGRAEEEAVS